MSRILIVDDNSQNLYLARFLLEKAGYEVEEASNGMEAIEKFRESDFSLILMDVQMPVMDGLEATQQIKVESNEQAIIALTARAMSGDKENILAAGCDGYIVKPIDPINFVQMVEKYL